MSLMLCNSAAGAERIGTWEGMLVSVYGYSSYIRVGLTHDGGYILQAGDRSGPDVWHFDNKSVQYSDGIYRVSIIEPFGDKSGYTEKIIIFSIMERDDEWMPSYLRGSLFTYWSGNNEPRRGESASSFELTEIKGKGLLDRINEGVSSIEKSANKAPQPTQ